MGYRQRLAKLRTKTGDLWWSATIGYPVAWRVVALVGEVKWITPNRITALSITAWFGASSLLLFQSFWCDVASAVLFQLHLFADCSDGTLARYRKQSTALGAFMDKIGDGAGFLFLGAVIGYRAYQGPGWGEGEPAFVMLGALGGGCYLVLCYMYWVTAYFELDARGPRTVVPTSQEHDALPRRTFSELLRAQLLIFSVNAEDFTFWTPVLIFAGRPDILVLMVFISQASTVLKMLYIRVRAMAALDDRT